MILLAGIYIHIPFCKQACHYCDFHFSTSDKMMDSVLGAINHELALQKDFLSGHPVSTIYFGGGTPSLLSEVQIENILFHIKKLFGLEKSTEVTLEANPDDLSDDYLKGLLDVGINRLSIGIQSFQQPVLEWMNRAHDQVQAFDCVQSARTAGFQNLSVDLIYGVPLPDYSFEDDLERAIEINPDHISAYNLTIEPGTVFGHQLKQGRLVELDDEATAHSFQLAMKTLKSSNYRHYEISNFCRPGKESKHNMGYWDGNPYLGIGPSAHSFDGQSRQYNVSSNGKYVQDLQRGVLPYTRELLTPQQRINEMILLGLRTDKGIGLQLKASDFHWDLKQSNQKYLHMLIQKELATIKKNTLLLTDKGKLLADRIAEDLFMDPEIIRET
jgi:oxygen-independent coproporphyrinogen-3 oxidase